MAFKVVLLRLITWAKLQLMKSDIGWVYITHSKVFISHRIYNVWFLSSSLCIHIYIYIYICIYDNKTELTDCLLYHISNIYYHNSYVLYFILYNLFSLIIIYLLTASIILSVTTSYLYDAILNICII